MPQKGVIRDTHLRGCPRRGEHQEADCRGTDGIALGYPFKVLVRPVDLAGAMEEIFSGPDTVLRV